MSTDRNDRNECSGSPSEISVVMPELSPVFSDGGASLNLAVHDAFSYADASGRKLLFGMREVIFSLLKNGQIKFDTTDSLIEFYSGLASLCHCNSTADPSDIDSQVKVALPGLIPESILSIPGICDEEFMRKFACIPDFVATVNVHSAKSLNFALALLKAAVDFPDCRITLTVGRVIQDELINACSIFILNGGNVSICSHIAAKSALMTAGISGKIGVYDGRLIVPGKSAVKCIKYDFARTLDELSVPGNGGSISTSGISYGIKTDIEGILDNESNKRYATSSRGKMYLKKTSDSVDAPVPASLFYSGCLRKPVRNIFAGGADMFEIFIETTKDFKSSGNMSEHMHRLSAAIRSLSLYYPFYTVGFFKDIRHVHDESEAISEIVDHCSFPLKDMSGGTLLELHAYESILRPESLRKLIIAFISSGGVTLSPVRD